MFIVFFLICLCKQVNNAYHFLLNVKVDNEIYKEILQVNFQVFSIERITTQTQKFKVYFSRIRIDIILNFN